MKRAGSIASYFATRTAFHSSTNTRSARGSWPLAGRTPLKGTRSFATVPARPSHLPRRTLHGSSEWTKTTVAPQFAGWRQNERYGLTGLAVVSLTPSQRFRTLSDPRGLYRPLLEIGHL